MIRVRLFHISSILHLAYIADQSSFNINTEEGKNARTDEIERVTKDMRDFVIDCKNIDIPDEELSYSEKLINHMAELHADKWIENVSLHTLKYSTIGGDRPNYGIINREENKKVLHKRYSGDVSGVIGETLFSIILCEHYGMNEYSDYSHLIQSGIRYPDFSIVKPSQIFKNEMRKQGIFSHYKGKSIPCEVKTFSNFDASDCLKRLRRAADQLVTYWHDKEEIEGVGIICIPILNTSSSSYDLYIVWCH